MQQRGNRMPGGKKERNSWQVALSWSCLLLGILAGAAAAADRKSIPDRRPIESSTLPAPRITPAVEKEENPPRAISPVAKPARAKQGSTTPTGVGLQTPKAALVASLPNLTFLGPAQTKLTIDSSGSRPKRIHGIQWMVKNSGNAVAPSSRLLVHCDKKLGSTSYLGCRGGVGTDCFYGYCKTADYILEIPPLSPGVSHLAGVNPIAEFYPGDTPTPALANYSFEIEAKLDGEGSVAESSEADNLLTTWIENAVPISSTGGVPAAAYTDIDLLLYAEKPWNASDGVWILVRNDGGHTSAPFALLASCQRLPPGPCPAEWYDLPAPLGTVQVPAVPAGELRAVFHVPPANDQNAIPHRFEFRMKPGTSSVTLRGDPLGIVHDPLK